MERREVVGVADTICHLDRRLRQLDKIFHAESRRSWIVDDDEIDEVDGDLDTNKFDILSTGGVIAVDDGQKDR